MRRRRSRSIAGGNNILSIQVVINTNGLKHNEA